mgnify:CR=1 FL=1
MSNKRLFFVELVSGSKRLVKDGDTVTELNGTKTLEEVRVENLVGWCLAYIKKRYGRLLEDQKRLLNLDFTSPADGDVLKYIYDCEYKDIYRYERELKIELAKILLAGKYLIKTFSYEPDIENGKYKYPWKRVARRSYDWVIPAGDYFDVDSGRRVEWRMPDVYNSRQEAITDLYGYKNPITPKDGDFLARNNGDVIMYKECPDNPNGEAYYYAIMERGSEIATNRGLVWTSSSYINRYRYEAEKETLLSKMKENGYFFDAENKNVEKIK